MAVGGLVARLPTMLRDAFLPTSFDHSRSPVFRAVEHPGVRYSSARWSPEPLGRLVAALREGGEELRQIPPEDLLAAWADTVATFLRQGSLERRALDPPLAKLCGLSREGLRAGLEAVLVVLASNLPGLAVQPLLPALAAGRPVLLKSSSAEPLFAPAFLSALARRE